VGFAIPINIAKRIVPQLIQNGAVRRPRLGVGTRAVKDLRDQVKLPTTDGLIVINVVPGSAAASAGIRGLVQTEDGDVELGDIIMSVDGQAVNTSDDLYKVLDKHQIGDTVQVEVLRNNRRVTLPVRLTEYQDQQQQQQRRGNLKR
jgi:S1-C subfamily serine protease